MKRPQFCRAERSSSSAPSLADDRTPMEEDNTHANTKWHTRKFGLQCGSIFD
jgi:hypothetical protein